MTLRLALLLLALAGCAAEGGVAQEPEPGAMQAPPPLTEPQRFHVPDFARRPYQALSRDEVAGVGLREWRAFGQLVDDDPPHTRNPLPPEKMPERQAGLWERVGEYWWLGQNADRAESLWTGKHDETGALVSPERADYFAWSAAFVSYVFRIAGGGDAFPYAASHYIYINAAARQALGREKGWNVTARRPQDYAPHLGDILCTGRDRAAHLRFDRLPARPFPAHCDIVVEVGTQALSVVGGNVDHAVTMKHVPISADGRIVDATGKLRDTRYDWFVILQVAYPS